MICKTLIILVLHLIAQSYAGDVGIIQKRFVNTKNIIARIPHRSTTSCYMKCSTQNDCLTIGCVADPALEKNKECLLLKEYVCHGIGATEGFLLLFVMIKNEDDFGTKLTDLPNCLGRRGKDFLTFLGGNIALMKPSTQISTYRHTQRASMGNDGRIDTGIATRHELVPWWQVDLEQVIQLRLVRLYLSDYALGRNIYTGLKVETKIHSKDSWTLCRSNITPAPLVNVTCEKVDTRAQYVRVQLKLNSRELLYKQEVEIYKWC